MSILGSIGKGLLGAIPIVGDIFSGIEKGRTDGKIAEAGIQQNQDRNKLTAAQLLEQALQGRANLDLNQKKMLEDALAQRSTTDLNQRGFALSAPGKRATNSVRGDVLANSQDATLSGLPARVNVPQISGGLRPSMLSGDTRALGKSMSRDALLQQMAGDKFDAPPPMATFDKMPAPSVPAMTPLPQAGGLDKFLSIFGVGGDLMQGLKSAGLGKPGYYNEEGGG